MLMHWCVVGLGLDEGGGNIDDHNTIYGGLVSFLQLRHLRVRDLQRTVRSFTLSLLFREILPIAAVVVAVLEHP